MSTKNQASSAMQSKFVEISRHYDVEYGYDSVERTYCNYQNDDLGEARIFANRNGGSVYLIVLVSDGNKTLVCKDYVTDDY